jgi:flagellar protein FliS
MENHIEQYRRTQVSGMTQKELIVMLYNGAIRFLTEAKGAIGENRYDQSCSKLDRARKVVLHLYSTLNMEAGPLAGDLAALYSYVVEQICVANATRETPPIDSCINVLATVKEAWEQVPDQEKKGVSPGGGKEQDGFGPVNSAERQPVGLSLKA